MKIFLARHGQTTGDIENKYGGDYEDHLTPEGIKQAEQLADKLSGKKIQIIFSSPRVRADETSEIINKKLNVEVKVREGFRERNHYGILTGMIKKEAKEKHSELVGLLKDTKQTIPGGESYEDFGNRIKKAWEEILNVPFNTIAIVSHGGPIRFIFREILKLGEINIEDCAFAEIDEDHDKFKLTKTDGITLEVSS